MEHDVASPVEAGFERPPLAAGVAVWALAGLLFGGLAPGVIIGSRLFFGAPVGTALPGLLGVVLAGELAGVLIGALLGVLDAPRRIRGTGPMRVLASTVAGVPLGALWGGASGALTALSLVVVATLYDGRVPTGVGEMAGMLSLMGGTLGAMIGVPATAVFSGARAWTLHRGWPWWLAHVSAAAVVALIASPVLMLLPVLFP